LGIVSILLGAVTAGCSAKPADRAAPTTPSPAPTGADTARIRVAGIGFQDDQFFKLVELGMKQEAAGLGVEFRPASSAGSLDKEISLVETFTAQRVQAICVAPLSQQASIPALKRAAAAGVKIVTFDSPVAGDFPAASIRSDQESLGRPTGEAARRYITEKLGGRANVAIISYMALAPEPASQRTKGFEDQVRTLPGVKIAARQDAWLAPDAADKVEAILTAHPEVDLIWAANEGGTVGAVTAVRNAGRAGKVVVFGTDMSAQIGDFLLASDNILQAVTGQQPFDIGQRAVQAAVKAVRGEPVERKVLLPGSRFERAQPDQVRKYQEFLRGLER
jgi:ABC-type sugar transport system substrate-binding protein